jgi:hypothetical protein
MNTPWDDGIITEDEFTMMLGIIELKQMFMKLSEKEQHEILKNSAPEKSKIAKTLDKLAKYLKSSWFRSTALKKAAEFGLNEEEADHFAKVWKYEA